MNRKTTSIIAVILLFFVSSVSADMTYKVIPSEFSLVPEQEALYTLKASDGKFTKNSKLRIYIEGDTSRVFHITSLFKDDYHYDINKKRLLIKNEVTQIRLLISFDKNPNKPVNETLKVAHSYDDMVGGQITFVINSKNNQTMELRSKVEPVGGLSLSVDPNKLTVEKKVDDTGQDIPENYKIKVTGGTLPKGETIKINSIAGASEGSSKLSISIPDKDNNKASYDESKNLITVKQETDSIEIAVKPHADTPFIGEKKFSLNHSYKGKDFGAIDIKLKGNSAGVACTTLDLNGLDSEYKGSCFNVHVGISGNFDDNVSFKPLPYTMLVSRSVLWSSDSPNTYKAEAFFEAELYNLPALESKATETTTTSTDGTTTTTQTTSEKASDTNPFTQSNNIYRLAAGIKMPLWHSKNSLVAKFGARKVPSLANQFNSTPVFYQLGVERAVSFFDGGSNTGRGIAGLALASDEFWQYRENDVEVNHKHRVILYGSVALNDTKTVLLQSYINANTKGDGPSEAVIRLSYGGNWESLVKSLMSD